MLSFKEVTNDFYKLFNILEKLFCKLYTENRKTEVYPTRVFGFDNMLLTALSIPIIIIIVSIVYQLSQINTL